MILRLKESNSISLNVKLFNMDVVSNTSKFMNDIGNETVMGLISISLLLNFLGKKIKLY